MSQVTKIILEKFENSTLPPVLNSQCICSDLRICLFARKYRWQIWLSKCTEFQSIPVVGYHSNHQWALGNFTTPLNFLHLLWIFYIQSELCSQYNCSDLRMLLVCEKRTLTDLFIAVEQLDCHKNGSNTAEQCVLLQFRDFAQCVIYCIISNTYIILYLTQRNNAQCAFWVVWWPCGQKLKSKNTLSDGKKIFLRLFFLCCFRKKTLKLVSLFIFRH